MKKTYFVTMIRKIDSELHQKSFFYHKPFFETRRQMIDYLQNKYPEWTFSDMKRIF